MYSVGYKKFSPKIYCFDKNYAQRIKTKYVLNGLSKAAQTAKR